jgi:putative addiction module component (TIGR02574 family)
MATPSRSELLKLDVQTRLEIIDELWDSVVHDLNDPDNPGSDSIPEATRALFDERMREYRANPAIGLPWASVRERLLKMT